MNFSPVAAINACVLVLLGFLAGATPARAQALQTVQLTSLEWPPYTAPNLAHRGVTAAVVSAAMAKMGYRLEVSFYPWKRATALVRAQTGFIGYFPEYMSKEVNSDFLLSDPIGSGPLGLAEHIDAPVQWQNLGDLARFQVGVVVGYINSEQFDERVRQGRQRIDYASSDKQNLLKLAAKRVPIAVIDRRVFDYLIRHDRQLAAVAGKLRFNARLLDSKQLYVCFRRTAEGERMRKILNEGLKKINVEAVMESALKDIASAPGAPRTIR